MNGNDGPPEVAATARCVAEFYCFAHISKSSVARLGNAGRTSRYSFSTVIGPMRGLGVSSEKTPPPPPPPPPTQNHQKKQQRQIKKKIQTKKKKKKKKNKKKKNKQKKKKKKKKLFASFDYHALKLIDVLVRNLSAMGFEPTELGIGAGTRLVELNIGKSRDIKSVTQRPLIVEKTVAPGAERIIDHEDVLTHLNLRHQSRDEPVNVVRLSVRLFSGVQLEKNS